jgi:hypothetical protein
MQRLAYQHVNNFFPSRTHKAHFSYSSFEGLGLLARFHLRINLKTSWTVVQPIARPLPKQDNTNGKTTDVRVLSGI